MSLAFHNGRFVPYSELAIAPHDAGFVFGATVTDFCRTYAHKLFRWPDHLARLRRDADACFIPLPYSDAELTAAAATLVSENTKRLPPDDDLALITFATPGSLGYMAGTDSGPPTVAIHTFPIPKERYRRFFIEGVTLESVGEVPDFIDPRPEVKHRSRVHWWNAAKRVSIAGAVPVLYADGVYQETALGAVLAVCDGVIVRQPIGPVQDSISVKVLVEIAATVGVDVRQRAFDWRDDPTEVGISEMLLTGSGFGIAGVKTYRHAWGGELHFPWPGPVFTKLAAAWSELVGVDIVKQFTG